MKKYLLILLAGIGVFMLVRPETSSAAISFVSPVVNGQNGPAGALTVTSTAQNVTAGNLLVANIWISNNLATSTAVTDTAGNTYTLAAGSRNQDAGTFYTTEIWYAKNVIGNAANVVTVTLSSTTVATVQVDQYAGADRANPFETAAIGTSTTGTTVVSASFAPAASGNVNVAVMSYSIGGTPSAGTSYTTRDIEPTWSNLNEDRLGAPAGSQTASANISTSTPALISVASFKVAPATVTWIAGTVGNWSTSGNWSSGVAPGATDNVIFSASSTVSSTWDAAGPPQIKSLTVSSTYTGILTIATSVIAVTGDWNFGAASSSLNAGTSTLQFAASSTNHTFTPGTATYYNLDNEDASSTLTISGTSTVAHNLIIGADVNSSFSGGTIAVGGNVTVSSTNFQSNGVYTDIILINGTGTQQMSSAGGWLSNVTVNKTSGTLVLSGVVPVVRDWTFTAGTMDAGTSTLQFDGFTDHTFTPGTATYYNLEYANISGNSMILTISGTSTVAHNLTIGAGATSTNAFFGGAIAVGGNVIVSSTNFGTAVNASNTAVILLNSTGTQQMSSAGGWLSNVTVNKTSGVVLVTTSAVVSKALAVQSGELRLGSTAATTTFEVDATTTVSSGGVWTDVASVSSTVKLGGSVVNGGVISLNGGAACGQSSPTIFVRSTVPGTQRSWSGAGTFVMRYVNVKDQTSAVPITVWNGANAGNNGSNWSFIDTSSINLIQTTNKFATGGSVTYVSSPLSFAPKPADLIVVAVAARGNAGISSVADNQGNTYTLAASTTLTPPGVYNKYLSVFYAKNVSGTMPFTVSSTVASPIDALTMAVLDYSGGATSSTLDTVAVNTTTVATTSITSGSVTATTTNELYFGAAMLDASTTASPGSGWTARVTQTDNTTYQSLYTEDMNSVSSITSAATWGVSPTATAYAAIQALFKPPLLGYPATGTVDSVTYDTGVGSGAQLNSVRWLGIQPAGTSVGFQFAVSNASSGPWTFYGPSGSTVNYYTPNVNVTMPLGYSQFNNFRYFRYRIMLTSDSTRSLTPKVTGASVNWSP